MFLKIYYKIELGLFILIIFFSCTKSRIDKNPVIKINDFQISQHEYNHELNKVKGKNTSEQYINGWKKNYLENSFLIYDAYKKGYDTVVSINDQLIAVSDFMMVQKYGYLWKETVSPVVDDFMLVTDEKAEKRKKLFYFDYIIVKNPGSTNLKLKINSIEDYNKLKSQSATNTNIQTGYASLQWPFTLFYENSNELYAMQPGEISSPVRFFEDIYYFYLDHIEIVELTENDRKNLSAQLQKIKEDEIDDKKTEEMLLNGKPVLNEKGINDLFLFCKQGNNFYEYLQNPKLLTYQINEKQFTLDYKIFTSRYNLLPYKPVLKDSAQIVSEIYQYFYDDYLKNEALNLGLYSKDEFVLDKRNYKNKLLLNHYNNVHFIDSVKIDSTELREYYLNNISTYTIPEGFCLDIFYFNRAENAEQFLKELAFKTESQKEYMDKAV
ncbi:MAG: hypothetical protein K9H26_18785, partial [Prolixibacteraceae bacterium]|nr:hypothetical protein [Prolixibacteraceae bacterium]